MGSVEVRTNKEALMGRGEKKGDGMGRRKDRKNKKMFVNCFFVVFGMESGFSFRFPQMMFHELTQQPIFDGLTLVKKKSDPQFLGVPVGVYDNIER